MREAEIKHSRLAMLAVVGWPLAELFDKPIADSVGLPTLLTKTGSAPSLANGGLEKIDVAYWIAVVALAGIIEIENQKQKDENPKTYVLGDCGFDPLGFFPQDKAGQMQMMEKEIKHGRIAMMAILGFVVQEVSYEFIILLVRSFLGLSSWHSCSSNDATTGTLSTTCRRRDSHVLQAPLLSQCSTTLKKSILCSISKALITYLHYEQHKHTIFTLKML